MRQTTTILVLLFLAAMPLSLQATHIVGGEMTYKCLGNDQYEVKLTIFRDCFNGIPWFDDPASIGIFANNTNLLIDNVLVPLDPFLNDTLDPTLDDDCLSVPPNVCVNTTTYTTTVELPFIPGGYHLVYQRCCRNNTIANLILPEDVGATYSIEVGEEALLECNSSPVFNDWPPLFLCAGVPYNIDQSAVDDDGDSLVYKLCNPLNGASDLNPQPIPPNPPPYDTVPWLPPFGVDNFTNNPAVDVMSIDPQTGLLTGTPNLLGQFVIGICVEEYRNGVLIGTNRRDYQVNVGDCEAITSSFFAPEVICGTFEVTLDNLSMNANDFLWFFNDPANPGATSTAFEPTYTYSDFGTYTITLISEPGEICADTSSVDITFNPDSLTPDFDVQVSQCAEELFVTVTDLSTDDLSTIIGWEWELIVGGTTYESMDQNPVFVIGESGAGTIILTVTSENGCVETIEEDFLLKSEPLVLDLGPNLEFCGAANVELDAGPGFISYEWSTSEDTQTITVTEEGTYSVTATDACGEAQIDEVSVEIDTVEINLPEMIEVCLGDSFQFDVPGFEFYEWTPGDYLSCTDCPNPTTTPEMSITYMLTAISADSCVAMGSTEVIVLPSYQEDLTFEVCEGETITYNGTELSPGAVVDFTFTAANGCDSVVTVTVNGLPNFASDLTLAACDGETVTYNGEELEGGTVTEFTFEASNGCDSVVTVTVEALPNVETSEEISICPGETVDIFGVPTSDPGVYDMVFDASNGCDSTHTITLTVFDAIDLDVTATDASCFGASDGSATASASGGSGSITFEWSTGDTGPTITGQPAGTYVVTATDAEGCTAEATVEIGEPTAVEVSITGVDVSCEELGSASANASGGTPDYTYEWSTGATTAEITDLEAGVYEVTATDQNGCTATGSVEITGALGPDASINVDQQLTEDMPMSGILTASPIGGTAPFEYEWSNGETESTIDSLGSGEYFVTITDANGCTAVDVAYLFVPACTGGKLWEDTDRDGCQEGGELGLGGIMVDLEGVDIWGNEITATTTSAINGEYIFEDLPPGDYIIFLPIPADYILSPQDNCDDDFTDSDFDENGISFVVNLLEGHCCLIVDGGLYDACLNVIDPGSICCDQTLCGPSNIPDPITQTSAPSGAGGPIEYMWMMSHTGGAMNNGSWSVIQNSNAANYAPGPLFETTYYTRCVRAIGCDEWIEGDIVKITVDDVAVADIFGSNSACVGDEVTYYSVGNNAPGATYYWHFGPWADPSSANTENATVEWTQDGVAFITLTVENDGCTSVAELGVGISNDPGYCGSFSPGQTSAEFGLGEETGLFLFPNPVNDELTVKWGQMVEGDLNFEILNLDGRIMKAFQTNGGEMNHRTDVSRLSSGMYILRVRDDFGDEKVFKFIKE